MLIASYLQSSKTYSREYIFEEGEPIYEIYFLLKGEAGYVVQDQDITVVYCKINPGNLFGELDFFYTPEDDVPSGDRIFDVKAIVDCELVSLTKEALYEIEKEYQQHIAEIFEYANYRLRRLMKSKEKAIKFIQEEKKKRDFKKLMRARSIVKRSKTANMEFSNGSTIRSEDKKHGKFFKI